MALMREVHARDRYPPVPVLPDEDDDFLVHPTEEAAWVAETGGRVVGHVALHPVEGDDIEAVAVAATGLSARHLALIARLFVAPDARGGGVGTALLETATERAIGEGRLPILDVGKKLKAAINLYEAKGWSRIGEVDIETPQGAVPVWIYRAPSTVAPK